MPIKLRFHHKGKFWYNKELKYMGRETKIYDKVDVNQFGWFTLKNYVVDLSYTSIRRVLWLLPNMSIGNSRFRLLKWR